MPLANKEEVTSLLPTGLQRLRELGLLTECREPVFLRRGGHSWCSRNSQGPAEQERDASTQQTQDAGAAWALLIGRQVSASGIDPTQERGMPFSHSEVRDNDYNFQVGGDQTSGLF